MRTLANYTIFEGKVWLLHVFETENGNIVHYPFEKELEATRYIEGIAIVCRANGKNDDIIKSTPPMPGEKWKQYAERMAGLLSEHGTRPPYSVYAVEFPLLRPVKLK